MKKLIVAFILINFVQNIYSLDIGFNVGGEIGPVFNSGNNKTEMLANIGILSWEERNLNAGLSVSLLRMEDDPKAYIKYSFLPLEIYYSPLVFGNMFYVTIYGRGEWQFRNDAAEGLNPAGNGTENYFLGTAGGKISMIWRDFFPHNNPYASTNPHISLFFEYNTLNQFKAGLAIDFFGWLMFGRTI